jgi:hypothetical protein
MLGQVECDGFDAGRPSKDRVMTPTGAFSDSIFAFSSSAAAQWCDSKANPWD